MRRKLAFCFMSFIAGLIVSRYCHISMFFLVFFLVFFGGAVFYWRRFPIPKLIAILSLFLIFGTFYGEWRSSLIKTYEWEDKMYQVEGVVSSFPQRGVDNNVVPMELYKIDGEEVKLNVLLVVPKNVEILHGDVLQVYGKAMEEKPALNGETFDYQEYLYNKNISTTLSMLYDGNLQVIGRERPSLLMLSAAWLRERFFRVANDEGEENGSVLRGIFLGETRGLTQTQLDVLSKSGIFHCFSVSGLHIGFLMLFLHYLLSLLRVPVNKRVFFMMPVLLLYTAITGFNPAVCRASVMYAMVYFSLFGGRQGDTFTAMVVSGFGLLLYNPNTLWLKGFQLSFIAMFSILYFVPFLQRIIRIDFPGKKALLVTLAAQIGMVPILAYDFGVVSILSFFVNMLACSLTGGIVLLSLMATILPAFLGNVFLATATALGDGVIYLMGTLSNLPYAFLSQETFPLPLLFGIYGVLLLLPQWSFLRFRPVIAGVMIVVTMFSFMIPLDMFRQKPLEVTFLSVGEADCIYITTPNGKHILVDAGNNKGGSIGVYNIRPFLQQQGVTTIDYVMVSHCDEDHVGSLPYLLEFFHVDKVVFSAAEHFYSSHMEDTVKDFDGEVIKVETGDSAVVDGVTFDVVFPSKDFEGEQNDLSMVLRVTYGDFSMLLTGDIGVDAEEALLSSGEDISADILKIPHHGSKSGYHEGFYEAVNPKEVIFSVGETDYGHPYEKIVSYWKERNIPQYRTDKDGAITITTYGKGYEISTKLKRE